MKVNMNIIVGGTDDILDNILSAARTVRKEIKKTFESVKIEALQKMDLCVCFSGNVSKYYPKTGICEVCAMMCEYIAFEDFAGFFSFKPVLCRPYRG